MLCVSAGMIEMPHELADEDNLRVVLIFTADQIIFMANMLVLSVITPTTQH